MFTLVVLTLVAQPTGAAERQPSRANGAWSLLGPIPTAALSDGELVDQLAKPGLDTNAPHRVGDLTQAPSTPGALSWTALTSKTDSVNLGASGQDATAWLSTRLRADRFMDVTLVVDAASTTAVYVDGEPVLPAVAGDPRAKEPRRAELHLVPGDHRVVVHTARAAQDRRWTIGVAVEAAAADLDALWWIHSEPRRLALTDVLDAPSVGGISLSADGEWAALSISRRAATGDGTTSWTELRRTADGSAGPLLHAGATDLRWAPTGARFAYSVSDGDGTTVWEGTPGGPSTPIAIGVEELDGVWWVGDGSSLLLSTRIEPEPDERGVKRLLGTADQWSDWRTERQLWLASPGGLTRPVTLPARDVSVMDVHPDGWTALLSRSHHDTGTRPYEDRELYELDLRTGATTERGRWTFVDGARYTADGAALLLLGGPSVGDGSGVDEIDGPLPNDYDGQIYRYELADGSVTPLTRALDPSVSDLDVGAGGTVLKVVDRARVGLRRLNANFDPIAVDVDVVGSFAVARRADVVAWVGSGANTPPRASVLRDGEVRLLADPAADALADVGYGEVRGWDATLEDGRVVPGRFYLPPDFDPAQKYPVIVYYYGGTSPTSRSFGGRYPKELWAANGYVVYVVQPSGATGYGQAWSSRHVGTWGRDTISEIVGATEAFVAQHAWADGEALGCIGASYGGFTTMLLLSHTDIFAAGVSHAGISSLSSYWGEGWWGHTYSAVASGESTPWSDPDLYVDQSPLFRADKIHTPLLLLHGTGDTNVPKGESDSLYTALKVLGQEVEYVQLDGDGHWIVDRARREVWSDTILAWFARELRGDAAWWEHLYGPLEADADNADDGVDEAE